MQQLRGRVVVVDDDQEMRHLVEDFLRAQGFQIYSFPSASAALDALGESGRLNSHQPEGEIDVIVSDIRMPQIDGLDFAAQLHRLRPEIPVILMTAFGNVETAIEAMKRGVFHYVTKPFKLSELAVNIDKALEHRKLQRDNTVLRQVVKRSWGLSGIIGKSVGMKSVFDLVARVSQVASNVLITGESGTGKELVARAIHESGPRSKKSFVAINCTALPEALLESELFGHAKGAFTGAVQKKWVFLKRQKEAPCFSMR